MRNNNSVLQHELESVDLSTTEQSELTFTHVGYVQSVADGVAYVTGLKNIFSGGVVCFNNNILGLAVNIEEEVVGVTILGNDRDVAQGDYVESLDQLLEIGVSINLLGCAVDALGNELLSTTDSSDLTSDEEEEEFQFEENITDEPADNAVEFELRPVEIKAPGIIARVSVSEPLLTGLIAVDSMIPIGRGQRELIIGDRQTGKTAIAVDTIINQYF